LYRNIEDENRQGLKKEAGVFSVSQDELFKDKREFIKDFDFGKNTSHVFDNMLNRSVPFYGEIQRMMAEMAGYFAVENTNLYDLGCSTGETFLALDQNIPQGVKFIGIDSSVDMLEKAEKKLKKATIKHEYELIHSDLNQGVTIDNASVVIMNLTLQFIRPLYRQRLVRSIAEGINENGCFIVVEKVLNANSLINRLFIKLYYDFKKRSGYNELEIRQKREALENILIPYRHDENRQLLLDNGFKGCECFFRWYNFCGIIAVK
jgi:tRNA (cmo5U34)-methyltransferase